MEDSKKTIILKPKMAQFIADYYLLIALCLAMMLFTGVDDGYISLFCLGGSCLFGLLVLYRLWFFTTIQWVVGTEKIKYSRGIFNRNTDYLELYRVIDYSEEQSLIQQLLNIKSVIIFSGDRSHSTLRIYGIAENNSIIDFIRDNVELQKKQKKIYEITNN